MKDKNRFLFLIAIMAVICLIATFITTFFLYRTALKEERERLIETATSQARLIEAVSRFDQKYSNDYPEGWMAATLSQIEDAHRNYKGFGKTGEFTLARREGDKIIFLLSHRHHDLNHPKPVNINDDLAVPMQLALSGKSGTIIALDYRGKEVLAAYEPVNGLDFGIVAKLDLDEVREPFIRAGIISLFTILLFILAGAVLFLKVSNPLLRQLETQNIELKEEIRRRKISEQTLQQNESFLGSLLNAIPIPVFYKDNQGRYLGVNMAFKDYFALSSDEIIGKTVYDINPPHYAKIYEEKDAELLKDGGVQQYESRVRNAEGALRDVVFNKALFTDEKGVAAGIIGTIFDITEDKQSEKELRDREMLLNEMGSIARIGGWEHDLINRKAKWTKETYKIVEIDESSPIPGPDEHLDYYLPEDSVTLQKAYQKSMETGEGFDLELRCITAKGKPFWARAIGKPEFVEGQCVKMKGTFQDITDLKRAEEELKQSEEFSFSLLENSPNTIIVFNSDTSVRYVNPSFEKITGYSPEEVIGLKVPYPWWVDDPEYGTIEERTKLGRIGINLTERRYVKKNGDYFWVELSVTPILDNGGFKYSFSTWIDITDRKNSEIEKEKLEYQLQQAQKIESIGNLAGGIAHDFNNMLSVILGYGEDILSDLNPIDPLYGSVKEIVGAGKRSAELTRQLLAFSRRQTLRPKVLNLNHIIENTEKMLLRLIGEDIELRTLLTDELDYVKVDPGQIEQIILNLTVNARDAMPKGGKLTIETANIGLDEKYARSHVGVIPGEYVMLSLTDNGCGMDKETQMKVFEPFYTTKEKGRGTGLGLPIVYGIVKQSEGNIWIYSELDKGTTVKIYFPKTTDDLSDEKVHKMIDSIEGKGEMILLVEDEPSLRKYCEKLLKYLNYRVMVAENGDEALLLLKEKNLSPDLVLTDVIMPKMSGKVLFDRIKKSQPNSKVLYMSGYTDNTIVHHGILDPETPFIQKPFTKEKLGEVLRMLLDEA